MLSRLYQLLERQDEGTCAPQALRRLIEAQAERVELQAFRIASQIIMSEPVVAPETPRIRKFTLEYAYRKATSGAVAYNDITFDAISFDDARRQLARYIEGLRCGSNGAYSYWAV